jgi:integrase
MAIMPRKPTLRKKKIGKSVYWFTKAGGETYFGNVQDVTFSDAKKLFAAHIRNLAENEENSKGKGTLTAGELIDLFLDWLQKNRSDRTYGTRRTYCSRFASFRVGGKGGKKIADLPATRIKSSDMEAWLNHLSGKELDPQTLRHAQTSVKHCWNWATKHPSPTPYLPPIDRPFASVERIYVPPKALTEGDLITDDEVKTLFAAAEIDLDQFHRFGPKTPRAPEANPYRGFADLLRCYYHTGARTAELVLCRVGDVLFTTQQVVLGKHKRSKTQRTPTLRTITLGKEAFGIFRRLCEGKQLTDYVFLNSDGRPYHRNTVFERFNRVKEVAAKQGLGNVRDQVTIYSFRDLWISEALMAGNDLATVARMAGTSVAMIERVYGHFRVQHLQQAQARVERLRKKRGR